MYRRNQNQKFSTSNNKLEKKHRKSENVVDTDNGNNTCVVCFKDVNYFSIGDCDHPVCYECSTRMRVLCEQNECPICRNDMPKVFFTQKIEPFVKLIGAIDPFRFLDQKYGICFENETIRTAYNKLLEHKCSICNQFPEGFRSFALLKDHIRRTHERFYCDLCTVNLKIFSFERRCYTRNDLATHRRKGDLDNTSHRGHPLCEFCDIRYMDSDELYRHLRRDHLFCHFCDADGLHHYYGSYDYLRHHFQSEHYLCEEGPCKDEQFTSVFRTDIDLKAHKASVHSKELGKAGVKQARTLELEFRLAPRPRNNDANGFQSRSSRAPLLSQFIPQEWNGEEGATGLDVDPGGQNVTPEETPPEQKQINALDPELFPSLNGAPAPSLISSQPLTRTNAGGSGITIRHTRNVKSLTRNDENFPALSSSAEPPPVPTSTVRLSVNSADIVKTPNVSIHFNHRPKGGLTTRISSNNVQATAPATSKNNQSIQLDSFPALGTNSSEKKSHPEPAQWIVQKSKNDKKVLTTLMDSGTNLANVPKSSKLKHVHNPDDFPSLNKTIVVDQKKNKTSSMTINNTSSWSSEESSKSSENKTKKNKKKTKNNQEISSALNNNNDSNKVNNNSSNIESASNNKNEKKGKVKKIEEVVPDKSSKVERKRTELKIGNLSTPKNEKNILSEENFPSLSNARKPPGFLETIPKPPPGFNEKVQKPPPPPGFSSVTVNSVARSANDLTFTNSSGQKYAILPPSIPTTSTNGFYPPSNFLQRNANLVENFKLTLTPEQLNEFRQFSNLYKEGGYNSASYYDHCREALGRKFSKFFPDLLALLPDIEKQNELFEIHRKRERGNKEALSGLEKCATCNQIVLCQDLKHHLANHTLENHFPILGKASSESLNNAWKK